MNLTSDAPVRLSTLFIAHLACQIPGLISLAGYISGLVRDSWSYRNSIPLFKIWVGNPAYPKFQTISEYLMLMGLLAGLTLLAWRYFLKIDVRTRINRGEWASFILYELACIGLPGIHVLAWVLAAGLGPAYLTSRFMGSSSKIDDGKRRLLFAAFVLSLMALQFATNWSWSPLRFLNETVDFEEFTRLDNGRLVNNRDFFREKKIPGKYVVDPCSPERTQGGCLSLPREVLRDARTAFDLFSPGSGLVYDWDRQILRIYRTPSAAEQRTIESLWGISDVASAISEGIWPGYPEWGSDTNDTSMLKADALNLSMESDTWEFLLKNRSELISQDYLGRFFFHHAYLYLPALESVLDTQEMRLPSQYGTGLARVVGMMMAPGNLPNFQRYYAVLMSGIGAYLVLTGIVVWWITKKTWAGLLALVFSFCAFLILDGEALRMSPGFNPLRHFPDLLIFVAIAVDARRRTAISAVFRALALGVFVWWNREFGLFFFAGSAIWVVLTTVSGQVGWRQGIQKILLEAVAVFAAIYIAGTGGINDLAAFNLLGIGAPETYWSFVLIALAIWGFILLTIVWGRFIWNPKSSSAQERQYQISLDVAGIGTIYAAFASIYVLWNPSPSHMSVIALCAAVPLTVGLAEVDKQMRGQTWLVRYLTTGLLVTATFLTVPNQIAYAQYEKNFVDHLEFDWHFPGLVGSSTGDPGMMDAAVQLLNKYQPSGRLLLISRYDVLLMTLANRMSMLPYVDLPSAVVGWEMIDKIAARIEKEKPPILFVDKDIFVDREWELIRSGNLKAVRNRVGALAALSQLFRSVSHCYESGEVGGVLQVWRRVCE